MNVLKPIYFSLLLSTLYIPVSNAQQDVEYELNKTQPDYPHRIRPEYRADIEYNSLYKLRENPSFMEAYYDSVAFYHPFLKGRQIPKVSNLLTVGYGGNDLDGDYLYYEGDKQRDYSVYWTQERRLDKAGSLSMSLLYANGTRDGVHWTDLTNTEAYLPYVFSWMSADTVRKYETYRMDVRYAFKVKKTYLGVGINYRGDITKQKQDPRLQVHDGTFGIEAGASRIFFGHLLGLKADYSRNTQFNSSSDYAGFPNPYEVTFGFGQKDTELSTGASSFKRMEVIQQNGVELTIKKLNTGRWNYHLSARYDYSHMATEEDRSLPNALRYNRMNAYNTYEDKLTTDLLVPGELGNGWQLSIYNSNSFRQRGGEENVFEYSVNYPLELGLGTYDYWKIDSRHRYLLETVSYKAIVKLGWNYTQDRVPYVLVGAHNDYYRETYKIKDYEILNDNLILMAGLGYKGSFGKYKLSSGLLYYNQTPMDMSYTVPQTTFDYQYAFTPYAYRSNRASAINLNLVQSYRLNRGELGLALDILYKTGSRDRDAYYGYVPNVRYDANDPESIPERVIIDPTASPDNKTVRVNARLFYLF